MPAQYVNRPSRASRSNRPCKEQLYAELETIGQEGVASKYKVKHKTVNAWRRHYGEVRKARPLQRPPKQHLVDLLKCLRSGYVCKLYGVWPSTLWGWKKFYRMSTATAKDNHFRSGVKQSVIEEYRARMEEGESKPELVKEFVSLYGCQSQTVYRYLGYQERV